MEEVFERFLNDDLRHRLHVIAQHAADFWKQQQHQHFTNYGPEQTRHVQEKLAQLLQAWNKDKPLSEEEIFVLFAASILYDIGMQCTELRPLLHIDWEPGQQLLPAQLLEIRDNKHRLTYEMIMQSVSRTYQGRRLHLGLEADEYTRRIAEVCQGCSQEPLKTGVEQARGPVRVQLLTALLRLADQLYIDKDRVNVALLKRFPLPIDQKIRWWLYHYTQTLPIEQGQITFRYSLPQSYQQFLSQIRTLIEQPFNYASNPAIEFLWSHLPLKPQRKADVEINSPHMTFAEMSSDMALELGRIRVDQAYSEPITQRQARENRCLVVLDYENFLVQMGLEGHFITYRELEPLMSELLIAAREQFLVVADILACAHWQRPDFRSAVAVFQDLGELLHLQIHEQSTPRLSQKLLELHDRLELPRLLLVAPPRALAATARELQEKGNDVRGWLTETPDARIFPARLYNTDNLSRMLRLSPKARYTPEELELLTASCILRLNEHILDDNATLPFDTVLSLLNQIDALQGRGEWWRLFLIYQGILSVEYQGDRYLTRLLTDHTTVHATLQKREAVLKVFQLLAPTNLSLQQNILLEKLQNHEAFQEARGQALPFLHLLQQENTLSIDTHTGIDEDYPLYQLNNADKTVVAFNADSYLPLFVLGLDHALVELGYSELREYTLNRYLSPYMENTAMTQATYQLAISQGWVKTRTVMRDRGYRTDTFVVIKPVYNLPEVQEVMLNRDLLLKMLFYKTRARAMQFDAFWSLMSQISDFTLKREELHSWLSIFHNSKLINVTKDAKSVGCNTVELCGDGRIAQLLIGRLNTCGVVLAMRTLPAKNAALAKPLSVIQQRITNLSTHDRTLALWAIEYAQHVKLVLTNVSPDSANPQNLLYLNEHHIVYDLDVREKPACQALAMLVRRMSRPHLNDGWIPEHLVMKEMGRTRGVFGLTHEEFAYWINTATHKTPIVLKERPNPTRPTERLLQAISQDGGS